MDQLFRILKLIHLQTEYDIRYDIFHINNTTYNKIHNCTYKMIDSDFTIIRIAHTSLATFDSDIFKITIELSNSIRRLHYLL